MKNVLTAIKDFFSRMFEKDLFIKITSLAAAIVIWFSISVSVYPTIESVIYNVPVSIELSGTYAEANNYHVISQSIEAVTVYIKGDRGQIGDLKSDDLTAVASAENVFSARAYNLQIEIVSASGKEFEVTKLSDSIVNVEFDEMITRDIPIKPIMKNISVAAGFISDPDEVVIVPTTVSVTGAKDKIDRIQNAYINVVSDSELTQTFDFTATEKDLIFYDDKNEIAVETSELTFNKPSFNVHVPILQKQVVELGVKITNAPESFNIEAFTEQLALSVNSLEIAAPSEMIREIVHLDIGSIDMREVDIGSVFTFYTADFLPEGYQNLSEINVITVTCPSEGLAKITIYIRKEAIQLINVPPQFTYEFSIVNSGMAPYFIGPKEIIEEELSYIDIVSTIDLLNNYDMKEGDYKLPVVFNIPAYDSVWCIGTGGGVLSPRATVTVKKIE